MELITLAHIKLNRIGSASASGSGFGNRRERKFTTAIADAEIETLRQLVIELAEANGESSGALHGLSPERHVGSSEGHVIFNIQGPHTDYTLPYAECRVLPALKVGRRYFQLKEVDTSDSVFLSDEAESV